MASLYERENGTWHAKWHENGKVKRMSLKTTSKQRAQVKLVDIVKSIESGQPIRRKSDMEVESFTKSPADYTKTTQRPHTVKNGFFADGRGLFLGQSQ